MRWLLLAAALAPIACVPDNGPLMRPGEDCMYCHGSPAGAGQGSGVANAGEPSHRARTWTIAGTVYGASNASEGAGVLGALVHIRDAQGFSFTLRSNEAGNFYSAEAVVFPLEVSVEYNGSSRPMENLAPIGSCNFCHNVPAHQGPLGQSAPGRVSTSGE